MLPLTYTDLEVGGTYLQLMVSAHGPLSFHRLTMLSTPDEEGRFDSGWAWEDEDDGSTHSFTTESFLESAGCPHKPRKFVDNFHRLFANTAENRARLESFVERQDLAGYLTEIGIENVPAAIEYLRCSWERLDQLMEENDRLWWSDDPVELPSALQRLSTEIDTHRVDGARD